MDKKSGKANVEIQRSSGPQESVAPVVERAEEQPVIDDGVSLSQIAVAIVKASAEPAEIPFAEVRTLVGNLLHAAADKDEAAKLLRHITRMRDATASLYVSAQEQFWALK